MFRRIAEEFRRLYLNICHLTSGDPTRDLFSHTPGRDYEDDLAYICVDEIRFLIADYAIVKEVEWRKCKSQLDFYHEFILIKFVHKVLYNKVLYCVITRGSRNIRVIRGVDDNLDKNYGEEPPVPNSRPIPTDQIDTSGELIVLKGLESIQQVTATPDISLAELNERNVAQFYSLVQRDGDLQNSRRANLPSFSDFALAAASDIVTKECFEITDHATALSLACDQVVFSSNGSSDFVKQLYNETELCQKIQIPRSRQPYLTLANVIQLADVVHRYHRSYRLARYHGYWYTAVIFNVISNICGCKPVKGRGVENRGKFDDVELGLGREDTPDEIMRRFLDRLERTKRRIARIS